MSRPPPSCGHPTSEPYIDSVPRTQHPISMPYSRHEPRQLLPQTEYGPLLAPPRIPVSERSADRYMLSSDTHQPRPQVLYPSQSGETRHYNTYEINPAVGHAHDYDSQRRAYDVESQRSNSSTMSSPVWSDKSAATHTFNPILPSNHQELKPQTRTASYRMPHGFDKLLHHEPEPESPQSRRPSAQSRYHLHIRQQPIAARACGAGDRDRRPVDPPPIVQILLTDFDSNSQEDRDLLQDPRFTVGCLLFPVSTPPWSESAETGPRDRDWDRGRNRERERETDGIARTDDDLSTPLLSGKAFMSPFYVDADPDPNSAPSHPSSLNLPSHPQCYHRAASHLHQPATFFIFADLSIRSAGLYRLQFRLMNWGSVEDTGQSMPILAEAWSDPFRVYPAKDFPGMRDSSLLAEGLKELGFVELKTRGHGKGKGKKRQ